MYDYEPELWIKMITDAINGKNAKRYSSVDFWVESLELFDSSGNTYSQIVPKLAVSFK